MECALVFVEVNLGVSGDMGQGLKWRTVIKLKFKVVGKIRRRSQSIVKFTHTENSET